MFNNEEQVISANVAGSKKLTELTVEEELINMEVCLPMRLVFAHLWKYEGKS